MRMFRWVLAAMLVALLPTLAAAQTDGRIVGTVRDSTNAFIPGATVTIRNVRTGDERLAVTVANGTFAVTALRPSTYTISAELDGFTKVEYSEINLAVGQELALDFEFRPAGVQENVTVVATAPVLDVSSARVGANVTSSVRVSPGARGLPSARVPPVRKAESPLTMSDTVRGTPPAFVTSKETERVSPMSMVPKLCSVGSTTRSGSVPPPPPPVPPAPAPAPRSATSTLSPASFVIESTPVNAVAVSGAKRTLR